MKNFILTSCVLILLTLNTHSQWQPVCPTFGINGLADIHFINHRGVVIGEWGYISYTTDSGQTWQTAKQNGTYQNFNCVNFTQGLYYSCGNSGYISLSSDSGVNWTSKKVGSNESFNYIHFYNSTDGWVCGNKGEIYSTQNGGLTWQKRTIASQSGQDAVYVRFFSPSEGLIVFRNGALLKTTNGGTTWVNHSNNNNLNISTAHFLTMNKGSMISNNLLSLTCVRYDSTVVTSSSVSNLNGISHYAYRMEYANDTSVFLACKGGIIAKSVNGGTTWTTHTYSSSGNLYGMHFFSASKGYMVGHSGMAIQTINGTNWTVLNGVMGNNPLFNSGPWASDIKFTTPSKGFMLLSMQLYNTTNGGSSWTQLPGVFVNAEKIAKASNRKLFIVSYDSSVYRSIDSGNTWQKLSNCPCKNKNSIYNFEFVEDKGYVLCGNGELYSTGNFGDTWNKLNINSRIDNFEIDKTGNIIFGIRNDSAANKFFRSFNSGNTWDSIAVSNSLSGTSISSFCLLDDSTILMTRINDALHNYVYKSTNRGITWKELSTSGPIVTSLSQRSIHLRFKKLDHKHVWMYLPEILGLQTLMEVYFSDDAGENWYRQFGYALSNSGALDVVPPSYTKFASVGRIVLSSDNFGQLTSLSPPGAIANDVAVTKKTNNTLHISWNKKNCDKYLLLYSANGPVNMKPMHGPEYVKFRYMGGNSSVAYFGTDTFTMLQQLLPNTTYHFALFEYNGSNYDAVYDVENVTHYSAKTYAGPVIDSITKNDYCSGDSITISFVCDVPVSDTVEYALNLSNNIGAWPNSGNGTNLIRINKSVSTSGTIKAVLPSITSYSNKYRIRLDVVSPSLGLIQGIQSTPISISTPVISNIYTDDSVKCNENMIFNFTDRSINSIPALRKWLLPDNSQSTDSNVTFLADNNTTIHNVKLISRNIGCVDTSIQNIYVYDNKFLVVAKSANSVCGNTPVHLRDTAYNTFPFIYKWYKNNYLLMESSVELAVTTPGSYYLHRTDPDLSCSVYSDTIIINQYKKPSVQLLSMQNSFCSNDSLLLTAKSDTACTYNWARNSVSFLNTFNNSHSDSVFIQQPGNYNVIAKNASDTTCQSLSTSLNIIEKNAPAKPQIIQNNKLLSSSISSNFYQWYKNDTLITGANGSSYLAQQTAAYKIQLTESNGCIQYSDPYWYIDPSSFREQLTASSLLNVYPNPFNEGVNISTKYDATLTIFDINGKIMDKFILNKGSHFVRLSHFSNGIYFIKAEFENLSELNMKIIKLK